MTKTKKKQRKTATNAQPVDIANPELSSLKEEPNVETLIKEAESAVDSFNYDEAAEKLKEVLKINSKNTKALEMLSSLYLEQSNWQEAEDLLKICIEEEPNTGHSKYFSIAQLNEGKDALSFYQKGIEILEKELENFENVNPSQEIERKQYMKSLSDAYCSVSEIFMTDCCFEENAEEKCFGSIESAIRVDPFNPEAYQCLANYHLVKEQDAEAKEAINKGLSLWLPHLEALRDGEIDAEAAMEEFEKIIPSYDSRIQISKLLIELEMFEEGTNILDGLIEEDDEVVEVWYLLGWLNYMQGDEYKMNAHYYLNRAKEVSVKTGMEDTDYLTHIHELLEELKTDFPLDDDNVQEDEECNFSSDSESENKMET